jgi:tetratricopeptide (TPR) repeat protein
MTARVSLTMIVKNEEATLEQCLSSVLDLVDEKIVVDTGSSDNTKEIAQQHGALVFDFPWPDSFAAARNESIRYASGQWLLWLDADEHLDDANRVKLRQFFSRLGDDNVAYAMQCLCASGQSSALATAVDHVRLFRNHPDIRWDYRVHEQILPAIQRAGHTVHCTDIVITHRGYNDSSLLYKKLERNLRLLKLDLAERPNDSFTLFNLGWAYADLSRCAEAIPLLERSLQHSNNADSITPKLYALLTQCHRRLGQHVEAWAVCHAGQSCCTEDFELLFLKGQLCYQRGDRAGARACWSQLLTGDSRSRLLSPLGRDKSLMDGVFNAVNTGVQRQLVQYQLAVLDREEGRFADAENHWRTILDDTASFHPARLGLAELYLQQERWPELETILAELGPNAHLDAVMFRARMHLARKEFAPARHLLEDVLSQAPHAITASVFLSHVLLQSGDEDAADQLLRRIVGMDPRQADSWRNLIVLYRRQNRLPEAIAAARAGCWHCPHDADLLLLQGALLQEAGDWSNAESCLLQVIEMGGNDGPAQQRQTTARHRLATMYRRLGRVREAVAHWRAVIAESPDFAAARRCLEECGAVQPLAN